MVVVDFIWTLPLHPGLHSAVVYGEKVIVVGVGSDIQGIFSWQGNAH